MSYTYRQAIQTLYEFLDIKENEIIIIDDTNERGIIYDFNREKCVIFIYPISCKQNNTQNHFDTRDSGSIERKVAWNYAKENNLKYFCFGVNSEQERYKDFVFSLESSEEAISKVSYRKSDTSNSTGTQVNIPSDLIPSKEFERILTPKGFFIAVMNKLFVKEYMKIFDNRPYMIDNSLVILAEPESKYEVSLQSINYNTGYSSIFPRNRIIFGAPGTGKSFTLNKEKVELLADGGEFERVTFHPDYSYANFVGTYKPTMFDPVNDLGVGVDEKEVLSILLDTSKTAQEKYDLLYDKFKEDGLTRLPILLGLYTDENFKTLKKDGTDASNDNSVERNHGRAIRPYVNLNTDKKSVPEIAYEYVPGPFMRTLVKSLKNCKTDNPKPFLLIIEEINRANMAAVFGDVFQLLDRNDKEVSEYPIQASEDIKKYLAKELDIPNDYTEIRIPDNMFIWATMNIADQGVYPMDTAFKRRWEFTYIGIDDGEKEIIGKTVVLGAGLDKRTIEWNALRKEINKELSTYKVNEDKLLGPFFLSLKVLGDGNVIDSEKFALTFKSKVIMYLFEDAAKQKRQTLFGGCADTDTIKYSSICSEFDNKGVLIFGKNISNKFPAPAPTSNTTEDGAE